MIERKLMKRFQTRCTATTLGLSSPRTAAALLLAVLVSPAAEKFSLPPETAAFKNGPGVEIAMGQCLLCHSADYVSTQPPLARPLWKASVLKMRDKYGAPLPEERVEELVDYLVKTYGTEAAK